MLRNILIVILVVALCVGGWMVYKQVTGSSSVGSGDVSVREAPAEKDRTDAAYTDLDGNQNKAPQTTTFDRSALPPEGTGGASNQPSADQKAALTAGSGTQITGPATLPQDQVAPQVMTRGNVLAAAPSAALPVSDTIAPNPPNGAVFAASGKFQWYRQGNLTWRVNSSNGAACIAFATMEEWQKQLVYTHGCGNA